VKITRRQLGLGAASLVALGAAAIGYRRFAGPSYAPTPYDDLLHQIVDRRPAATLGQTVVRTMPRFNTAALATQLRQTRLTLAQRARTDAKAGRVTEAGGWVVPESVALYSALAAQY
jgi:hypothetical protein